MLFCKDFYMGVIVIVISLMAMMCVYGKDEVRLWEKKPSFEEIYMVYGLMEAFDEQIQQFRTRWLKDEYVGLVMDAMYIQIKVCCEKRHVVVIIGLEQDGSYELLAFKVCYSENSVCQKVKN